MLSLMVFTKIDGTSFLANMNEFVCADSIKGGSSLTLKTGHETITVDVDSSPIEIFDVLKKSMKESLDWVVK